MITSGDLLQETLEINVLTALKSSLEHRCKDILGSTLDNVCSVHRRVFSTWEGYDDTCGGRGGGGGEILEMYISTSGDVQYIGAFTINQKLSSISSPT